MLESFEGVGKETRKSLKEKFFFIKIKIWNPNAGISVQNALYSLASAVGKLLKNFQQNITGTPAAIRSQWYKNIFVRDLRIFVLS